MAIRNDISQLSEAREKLNFKARPTNMPDSGERLSYSHKFHRAPASLLPKYRNRARALFHHSLFDLA